MKQEELFLENMPESNNIWKEIGGNYEFAEQSTNELVDNAISNIIGNNCETKKIEITLEETNDMDQAIIITVEDSGSGVLDPTQAFTLGSIGSDSVFNEHGFGWKQAFAAANPENNAWWIYLRGKNFPDGKMMFIEAPYVIGKQKAVWANAKNYPGHSWGNSLFKVRCNSTLFRNMIDAEASIRPEIKFDFDTIADHIYEDLGFTYANVIENEKIKIKLTLKHANGTKESYDVQPIKPMWKSAAIFYHNEELHFDCLQGSIEALPNRQPFNNNSSNKYYKQNISSSGVEIRINGRLMEYNLFEEIYGTKNHPEFNDYLIQVNIISDKREDLPSTRTTKNGFRIGDEQLAKIFMWLRKNIRPKHAGLKKPIKVTEKEQKKKLAEIIEKNHFSDKELELDNNPKITQSEVSLFTSQLNHSYPKSDLIVTEDDEVTVIETKKNFATVLDLYQLMMYCDGYYADHDEMPDHAILIAKEFPEGIRRIADMLNKKNKGIYPEFVCKYWNEYMENFEEVIRDEKKLKMKY